MLDDHTTTTVCKVNGGLSTTLRWSSKSGHKLNLTLCSYGKEDWKNTASKV
jgi:hypothetical protein